MELLFIRSKKMALEKEPNKRNSRETTMRRVLRAWCNARAIRLFVPLVLVGAATQLVLSQGSRVITTTNRPTKVIGTERLVSIEPLPEMGTEMCPPPTATNTPQTLLAAATAPESLMAALQQSRAAGATSSAPP